MAQQSLVRWARLHVEPLLTVAALVLSVILAASSSGPRESHIALAVIAWLPLVMRTRWPLRVTGIVVALDSAHIAVAGTGNPPSSIVPIATMLAVYTLGMRSAARVAWPIAAMTAAVEFTVGTLTVSPASTDLLLVNWTLVATTVGRLVREQHERLAAAEQRADDARRTSHIEAERQVTEERLRIAHDLHDVLAHHIALVNAQAGVALYLLRSDPDKAAEALGGITENSRAALEELRTTLGLLRLGENGDTDRRPTPGAQQLSALAQQFTSAGMRLKLKTVGRVGHLSAVADVALYRLAQEALTNASKHAPGSDVSLTLRWADDSVHLHVRNGPAGIVETGSRGTGHGLIGMRERATSCGGSFDAYGDSDGGFTVTATLPVLNVDTDADRQEAST